MRSRTVASLTLATLFLSLGAQADDSAARTNFTTSPPILLDGGTVGPPTQPANCSVPVVNSALPTQEVQQLGVHTVGETLSFHVRPLTGTISIIEQAIGNVPYTLMYGGSSVPNGAVPTLLTEPNGTVLYDDTATPPTNLATAHVVDTYGVAATGVMTLPNTAQAFLDSRGLGYPAGEWSVQVNDYALECLTVPGCLGGTDADQYEVSVITKRLARAAGTVDLAVFLASEELTAPSAVVNPSVNRFADTLSALYGQVGVQVGTVTFYDLPPWAKSLYATGVNADDTGPCSDLGQLLSLSLPGDTINLFFVDAIQPTQSQGEIVGIDGSIPGPASLGGTVTSGAILNDSNITFGVCGSTVDFGNCGADQTAYIAAHEGGHFLGLYHTTEAYGDTFDPLSDTPICTCNACFNATQAAQCESGQLSKSATTCTQTPRSPCGGGDNLMFWLLQPPVSQGLLSPEQGRVMRANPAVQ